MTEQMHEQVPEQVHEPAPTALGNLPMACVGGAVGAVAMTGLSYVWFFNSLIQGLLTGIVVGLLVRSLGRGTSAPFGVVGAAFGVIGTFAAFLLVTQMNEALLAGVPLGQHLSSQSPVAPVEVYFKDYFNMWHGLAFAVAAFEGFSIGSRRGW